MNIKKLERAPERVISRKQFRELTGISRTTEWRLDKEGCLPDKIVIRGNILGYSESSYYSWLELHSLNGGEL